MGVLPEPAFRQRDAHEVEQFGGPRTGLVATQGLVAAQHLADLAADGEHRVERGHRLLEHVRDVAPADVAQRRAA